VRLAALLLLPAVTGCGGGSEPSDPRGAYLRGVAALDEGRPAVAHVELMNAVKGDPGNGEFRLANARLHLAVGNGVAAEAELMRARDLRVAPARTRHLMAHALLLQGHHDRAIQEAEQAAPEHRAYASRILGHLHLATGNRERAAKAFAEALAAGGKDPDLLVDVSQFRLRSGDVAGAHRLSEQAVRLAPKHVGALTMHGRLVRRVHGPKASLSWFDKALAANPDHVPSLLERAATRADLGQMRAMLADTRRVLAVSKDDPNALFLQATLAARAGKYELARSLYRRTGDRLEAKPAAMLLASLIDFQTGNVEQAAARLEKLLAAQPGNARGRRLLAAAYWKQGNARAAAETIRPLAERPGADAFSLRLFGHALERQGEKQAAAVHLGRVAALEAADRHLRGGQWQAAIDVYEKLLRSGGLEDPLVLNNLASAYAELKRYDQAIALARKAHGLDGQNYAIADTLGWTLFVSGKGRAEGLTLLDHAARGAPPGAQVHRHLALARAQS
jgi:tetratricopeptide (TPR) repeat protein